jgi:flagellar biogenesis protein FliO
VSVGAGVAVIAIIIIICYVVKRSKRMNQTKSGVQLGSSPYT